MLTPIKPKSREINKVERKENTLFLYSDYGILALEPKNENIVRVIYTVRDSLSDKEKPGIVMKDSYGDWDFTENDSSIELCLKNIKVSVNKGNGAVSYYAKGGACEGKDIDGRLLFKERDIDSKEFEEFESLRLAGVPQKTRIIETADGKKEVLEDPFKVSTGKSYHIRFNFELGDEALFGLGQQEKGFASLRGKTLYIHQGNRKIAVPMFVSTNGYGILVDTYSPLIFNDNQNGTYIYTEADQELDYYFIAGVTADNKADMNEVISGYRFLTGKAALLPKWAFGYVQSQERYETQEEILATVKKSRELGIGMDCLVLDWLSWPDNQWGQKSYDESRFPDPKGMIEKMHDDHVHFMISIWPTMAGNTENHKEFAEKNLFLPANTCYDAFKKEARELYFDQLKRTHFSYGTDAWWCDSSEPFTPEWNHLVRPEEGVLYKEYLDEAGLRMTYEYCNSFPLYHAMGIYENQRKAMEEAAGKDAQYKEKRVCNLTRSAYTGQQRYGTIMWSGDTDASWGTLKNQVAIGLHFSASGIPFWTNDIGAFFVKHGINWYWDGKYDDTADNKGYCELYTRWYQYSAFLPMFRAHGTDVRRELWTFKGEFYDALLKANRLRYRLMPYIYSEAGKVWLKDASLIRWLAFDFADDKNTWGITDQFMFGESIMVCPVLDAMYYDENGESLIAAEKQRSVYLPAGCDWFDFYTGEKYEGGKTVTVSAPLDIIPFFVKDGSIIPMRAAALSTEEQNDEIEFKRFGNVTKGYEFYEDAGDGYGYEKGEYKLTVIK
jgi:alpha-D-xyloside xylohydrolase